MILLCADSFEIPSSRLEQINLNVGNVKFNNEGSSAPTMSILDAACPNMGLALNLDPLHNVRKAYSIVLRVESQ